MTIELSPCSLSKPNSDVTFEVERLVPARVECASLDLGLQSVLLVQQQRHAHIRVRQAVRVLGRQVLCLLLGGYI